MRELDWIRKVPAFVFWPTLVLGIPMSLSDSRYDPDIVQAGQLLLTLASRAALLWIASKVFLVIIGLLTEIRDSLKNEPNDVVAKAISEGTVPAGSHSHPPSELRAQRNL